MPRIAAGIIAAGRWHVCTDVPLCGVNSPLMTKKPRAPVGRLHRRTAVIDVVGSVIRDSDGPKRSTPEKLW